MEQVKIYQLDVTKFEDPQCFQKHYAMLSKGRQKKIDAYRVDNAKRLSLGAGVLLERGLRRGSRSEFTGLVDLKDLCGLCAHRFQRRG